MSESIEVLGQVTVLIAGWVTIFMMCCWALAGLAFCVALAIDPYKEARSLRDKLEDERVRHSQTAKELRDAHDEINALNRESVK